MGQGCPRSANSRRFFGGGNSGIKFLLGIIEKLPGPFISQCFNELSNEPPSKYYSDRHSGACRDDVAKNSSILDGHLLGTFARMIKVI